MELLINQDCSKGNFLSEMTGEKKILLNACRICLEPLENKGISLYQPLKDAFIFMLINSITDVKIRENDGLPDKICTKCIIELDTAISFKRKYESSCQILLELATQKVDSDHISEINVKKEEPVQIEFLDDAQLMNSIDLDNNFNPHKKECLTATLKENAPNVNFECHDCGLFFKSKCKLRVHWKKIHLPETLVCKNCKKTFKSIIAMNNHLRNKTQNCMAASKVRIEGQGKSRIFYCTDCNYKSHRVKDVETHLTTHTGDRPFQCNKCPRTYTQISSLQNHKEAAHKEYFVELTCQYCGKFIQGRRRAYLHLKSHTDNQHQCKICNVVLKTRKIYLVHMQKHSGIRKYTCDKCAKSFYNVSALCNHIRSVHNKGKYWYYCDLCSYKSIRSYTIKKHKAKHTASNIPCTVCGVFVDSQHKLMQHQRRHFEEKKYECPQCEHKFFRKDSMYTHVRKKHQWKMLINKEANMKKELIFNSEKEDNVLNIST